MKRRSFAILAISMSCASLFAAGADDRAEYCKYIMEQGEAQRDLLRTPSAVAGFTQPNTGLPMQLVYGVSGSLASLKKSGITMEVARQTCELYGATLEAQQHIQYAASAIEKEALQHRVELVRQATTKLDGFIADATRLLESQNLTRPTLFSLQTAKIKLTTDEQMTQLKIAALYTPALSTTPLTQLVAEKQSREEENQKALDKLSRQSTWDVALSVGEHHQVDPLFDNSGAYGEVTISYNLATRAVDRHLDAAADSYGQWKKVQEGDVVRNAHILKQQLMDTILVEEAALNSMQQEEAEIEKNLHVVEGVETSSALDFKNQLLSAQLLLQVEIGDATFRVAKLREFLSANY